MTGNVGDLTLDLKVGGDVKALDAAIAKVKALDSAVTNLNKNLKNTDAGLAFKAGSGSASGFKSTGSRAGAAGGLAISATRARNEWTRDINREERITKKRAKLEDDAFKKAEKDKKQSEKEEIKRRKDAEKDAKKFFSTIQGGFEKVGKFGLGVLTGGAGVAAAAVGAGAFATSVSNVGSQYGINTQEAQKWKNILRIGSGGALSDESALGAIAGIQAKLGEQAITGQHTGALLQLGLDPAERSAIKVLEALRDKSEGMAPDIRTALLSEFGISPDAGVALNRQEFSDKDFYSASLTPGLSDEQIEANKRFAVAVTRFEIATKTFIGGLLAKAAPTAEQIVNTLSEESSSGRTEAWSKAIIAGGLTTLGIGQAVGLGLAVNPYLAGAAVLGAATIAGGYELSLTPEEREANKAAQHEAILNTFMNPLGRRGRSGSPINGAPLGFPSKEEFERQKLENMEQLKEMSNSADFKDIIAKQYSNDDFGTGASVTNNFNTEFSVGTMNSDTVPLVGQTIERSADRITDSIRNNVNSY